MFIVEYSKEEKEKVDAARAARADAAEKRNAEALAAYKKSLVEVDYDETRLIIYKMPDTFGGAVIHRVPTDEAWAVASKRIMKALLSDGKKDDSSRAIAGILEQPALLVHPSLPEFQTWRRDLPDLYSEVHNGMDGRCSHGMTGGK